MEEVKNRTRKIQLRLKVRTILLGEIGWKLTLLSFRKKRILAAPGNFNPFKDSLLDIYFLFDGIIILLILQRMYAIICFFSVYFTGWEQYVVITLKITSIILLKQIITSIIVFFIFFYVILFQYFIFNQGHPLHPLRRKEFKYLSFRLNMPDYLPKSVCSQ